MPHCSASSLCARSRLWALLDNSEVDAPGTDLACGVIPGMPPHLKTRQPKFIYRSMADTCIRTNSRLLHRWSTSGSLRRPWRRRFSNWWQWAVPPIICPNALVSPRSFNYCWMSLDWCLWWFQGFLASKSAPISRYFCVSKVKCNELVQKVWCI